MAFQDSAESLAEKLHLSRVPRPVFAAIALVLALVVALAVFAFATSPGSGFEVTAASDETAAQSAEDAGEEEARADGAGGGSVTSPAPPAADGEDVELPAGGDATARRVCIHVDGCVAAPGVYYLEAGSRVIDAVTAAGGATDEARTDAVNLARRCRTVSRSSSRRASTIRRHPRARPIGRHPPARRLPAACLLRETTASSTSIRPRRRSLRP